MITQPKPQSVIINSFDIISLSNIVFYGTEKLSEMGFSFTKSKANFIFAKHEKADGKKIYLKLKEKGVLVRHFDSARLCAYNRITVGSKEQMQIFIDTLKEVLEEIL